LIGRDHASEGAIVSVTKRSYCSFATQLLSVEERASGDATTGSGHLGACAGARVLTIGFAVVGAFFDGPVQGSNLYLLFVGIVENGKLFGLGRLAGFVRIAGASVLGVIVDVRRGRASSRVSTFFFAHFCALLGGQVVQSPFDEGVVGGVQELCSAFTSDVNGGWFAKDTTHYSNVCCGRAFGSNRERTISIASLLAVGGLLKFSKVFHYGGVLLDHLSVELSPAFAAARSDDDEFAVAIMSPLIIVLLCAEHPPSEVTVSCVGDVLFDGLSAHSLEGAMWPVNVNAPAGSCISVSTGSAWPEYV